MKRWTTSVSTSFDWVMSQVENHDALVGAAIREMQTAGAKARVQLDRVRRDGERMKRRVGEVNELIVLWNERAIKAGAQEKEKAIECLRRKHQSEREAKTLEAQIAEHIRVESQLTADLKVIDERIGELRRKKNTLNARQYRAEALKAGQLGELGLIGEIDEIFDRWEVKLGQYEGSFSAADPLAEGYAAEEERSALEAELASLVERVNKK